jgi:DNA-binding response OmpR family regulator
MTVSPKSRQKRSALRTAQTDGHRVLIVDDDDDVRALFNIAFERASIGADLAGSGLEAMQFLERSGDKYCCLLLDLKIPPPVGDDIARFAGEKLPQLPIIVISGHPELAERLPKIGRDSQIKLVMMKPVDPAIVVDYVRGQCARTRHS